MCWSECLWRVHSSKAERQATISLDHMRSWHTFRELWAPAPTRRATPRSDKIHSAQMGWVVPYDCSTFLCISKLHEKGDSSDFSICMHATSMCPLSLQTEVESWPFVTVARDVFLLLLWCPLPPGGRTVENICEIVIYVYYASPFPKKRNQIHSWVNLAWLDWKHIIGWIIAFIWFNFFFFLKRSSFNFH